MISKILIAALIIMSVSVVWLWNEYNQVLVTSVVLNDSKIIEIKKGDGFNQISHKLLKQDIAIKPLWFKLIAYRQKVINKLKAGEYELSVGMTMPELLNRFALGKSIQYSITFPEGWNYKQIKQLIKNNPHLNQTLENIDYQSVMANLGSEYKYPEGLFFPDTYFFEKGATDISVLKRAYDKMELILKEQWKNKEMGLPLESAYEALILASIIEKETGAAAERAEISGVFTRRLRKGMLLQTDPTVIYGMGEYYKGNIRYKDLRKSTPYNTYVIKGLPPTPIAMPGEAAINAALHPKKGNSLYFVAKGDKGTHYFSATLKEHNNAVNRYQRNR